jgi:hypothetical protein
MNGREISKNGVRLPDHQITVDHGRDLRIRIELAVGIGQRIAELAAVILAGVGQTKLLEAEDRFLHVSRCLTAQQSDHVASSVVPGGTVSLPAADRWSWICFGRHRPRGL